MKGSDLQTPEVELIEGVAPAKMLAAEPAPFVVPSTTDGDAAANAATLLAPAPAGTIPVLAPPENPQNQEGNVRRRGQLLSIWSMIWWGDLPRLLPLTVSPIPQSEFDYYQWGSGENHQNYYLQQVSRSEFNIDKWASAYGTDEDIAKLIKETAPPSPLETVGELKHDGLQDFEMTDFSTPIKQLVEVKDNKVRFQGLQDHVRSNQDELNMNYNSSNGITKQGTNTFRKIMDEAFRKWKSGQSCWNLQEEPSTSGFTEEDSRRASEAYEEEMVRLVEEHKKNMKSRK